MLYIRYALVLLKTYNAVDRAFYDAIIIYCPPDITCLRRLSFLFKS